MLNNDEFDRHFAEVHKTVRIGAGLALVGSVFGLVITGGLAAMVVWAVGRLVFHAW